MNKPIYKIYYRYTNIDLWKNKSLHILKKKKWKKCLYFLNFKHRYLNKGKYLYHYKKLNTERLYYVKFNNKQILKKYLTNYNEASFKKQLFTNYLNFEKRLDFNIYQTNLVTSLYAAKFLISKGFILVNKKKVYSVNYLLKKNDLVEINSKAWNLFFACYCNKIKLNKHYYMHNIEFDVTTLSFIFLDNLHNYILNYTNFIKKYKLRRFYNKNLKFKFYKNKIPYTGLNNSKKNIYLTFFNNIYNYYLFNDKYNKIYNLKRINLKNPHLKFKYFKLIKYLKCKYNQYYFKNILLKSIFQYKYNYLYYLYNNNILNNFENINKLFNTNLNISKSLNSTNLKSIYFKYYYNLMFNYYFYLIKNYYYCQLNQNFNQYNSINNYNYYLLFNQKILCLLIIQNKLFNFFNNHLVNTNLQLNNFSILYKIKILPTKNKQINSKIYKRNLYSLNKFILKFSSKYYKYKIFRFCSNYHENILRRQFFIHILNKFYKQRIKKYSIPQGKVMSSIISKYSINNHKNLFFKNYNKILYKTKSNNSNNILDITLYTFIKKQYKQNLDYLQNSYNQILYLYSKKYNYLTTLSKPSINLVQVYTKINFLYKQLKKKKLFKSYNTRNINFRFEYLYFIIQTYLKYIKTSISSNVEYSFNKPQIFLYNNFTQMLLQNKNNVLYKRISKKKRKNIYILNSKQYLKTNTYFTIISTTKHLNISNLKQYFTFNIQKNKILKNMYKRYNSYNNKISHNYSYLYRNFRILKYKQKYPFLKSYYRTHKYKFYKKRNSNYKIYISKKFKNYKHKQYQFKNIITKFRFYNSNLTIKNNNLFKFNMNLITYNKNSFIFNNQLFFIDLILNFYIRKLNSNFLNYKKINNYNFIRNIRYKKKINTINKNINISNNNLLKKKFIYKITNISKYPLILNTKNPIFKSLININSYIIIKNNYYKNINKYKNTNNYYFQFNNLKFKYYSYYNYYFKYFRKLNKYSNKSLTQHKLFVYFTKKQSLNNLYNIYNYYSINLKKYKIIKYIFLNYIKTDYDKILTILLTNYKLTNVYQYNYIKTLYYNLLFTKIFNNSTFSKNLNNLFEYKRNLKIMINYYQLITRFYK